MSKKNKSRGLRVERRKVRSALAFKKHPLIEDPKAWTALQINGHPRRAVLLHASSIVGIGLLIGLFIGPLVLLAANALPNNAWIYSVNIAIAIVVKLLFQWLWVLIFRPRFAIPVSRYILEQRGDSIPQQFYENMRATDLLGCITVIVTVTTALATVLTTVDMTLTLYDGWWRVVLLTALAGAATGGLESLSMTGNIQALVKNRHGYQGE